jgi:hypothetical protein
MSSAGTAVEQIQVSHHCDCRLTAYSLQNEEDEAPSVPESVYYDKADNNKERLVLL